MAVSANTVLCDWIDQQKVDWDVCATLHVPAAMRAAQKGWTANWLSLQICRYFNTLDRRVFKAAHSNRGVRINRWVVLENSDGVGWHAHLMLQTPEHVPQASFISLADSMWHRQCERYSSKHFQSRLSVIEPLTGNFGYYTVKSVHDAGDGSKGVLDLRNIHLPK